MRKCGTLFVSLLAIVSFAPFAVSEESPDDIVGLWYSDKNESKIDVYKAKSTDGKMRYYGKIIWLDEALYDKDDPEAGKAKHDRKNPDEERQADPIVGMKVLKGFLYNKEEKVWDSGTIYDPDVGKLYKCTMWFTEDSAVEGGKRLDVRGYIGVPLLGRTTAWTRVPPEEAGDDAGEDS